MTPSAGPLLLVGGGKMGGALLRGWLERGLPPQAATVVEPAPGAALAELAARGVNFLPDPSRLATDLRPAVVLLAVKPQVMDAALPPYRRFAAASPETVFLSVAAGKTLAFFARHLGPHAAVVRSMPNTPAAVGRGITVACANAAVRPEQKARCTALLEAVGEVAWLGEEELLDPVTAVSGGGPAYVFLLVECLAEAGRRAGLPADLAMRLARATVAGAGELIHRSPEPAAALRQAVTSPGGTTLEALNVLMRAEGGLQSLLTEAIAAATRRSRELAD